MKTMVVRITNTPKKPEDAADYHQLWAGDGVKTKLSLLLPTLPVARRGYERVVENGVVSSTNETKG